MTISSTRDQRASIRLRLWFALRFDKLVDERGGGGKAHSPTLTTGGDGQAGGKMTLAGAGITDQQDRLGASR